MTQKQQFTLAVAAVIILALAGVAYYATVYSVTKTEFEVYTTCFDKFRDVRDFMGRAEMRRACWRREGMPMARYDVVRRSMDRILGDAVFD